MIIMPNPLVSVIIPAYNAENFIAETLSSIFAQIYRPIEIVVVDDGSTDKTAEIVKNYQTSKTNKTNQTDKTNKTNDTDLIYIYQHNAGPSSARNTGIKAAKGEYIAFLDADDLWTKEKLDKQIQLFKKEPDLDIVFTDAKITRFNENRIEETVMFHKKGLNKEFFGHNYIVLNPLQKLLKLNFMLTPTVVAKRSCFRNDIFFNEKRKYTEDWELWLKMSLNYKFGYVNDVCVHVRDVRDGLSSHSVHMLISQIDILENFLKENTTYVSSQISEDELSKYIKDTYKWAGYHFMLKGNTKLARQLYRKSMKESFDVKTCVYYFKSFVHNFL